MFLLHSMRFAAGKPLALCGPGGGGVLGCDPQYVCQRAGYVVLG